MPTRSEPNPGQPPGLTAADYLRLGDAALLAQCDVHTYRSSGPGGQKRNKTDSAVRLRHRPTELTVVGTESRSQHENKARALRRLRRAVVFSLRRPLDSDTYVRPAWLAECFSASGRFHVGRRDARYLPAICEVLDILVAGMVQVAPAARALGISTAHLVALLKKDPELWERVNRLRREAGLRPLR